MVVFGNLQCLAYLLGRVVLQHPELHGITQVFGQIGNALQHPAHGLTLLCHIIGTGIWAGERESRSAFVIIQTVQARTLPHQINILVLEDGRQPGAQGGSAGKAGVSGRHRLKHVVHQVFGQCWVVQLAPGKAKEAVINKPFNYIR